MAMLAFARRISFARLFPAQIKLCNSPFHTLKKLDGKLVTGETTLLTPKRNYFWIFRRRTKSEIQSIDKAPPSYELIYRCGFDNYFLSFQYLGFFATVSVCLVAIFRFKNLTELPPEKPEYLGDESGKERPRLVFDQEPIVFLSAFFFVVSLIYLFCGRMPMRIYCHPHRQQYLLYFYGVIPNQLRTVKMKVGEIKHKPSESVIVPWSHQTYECEESGQKLLLFDEFFRCPADLYIMLGLQKDPDVNYDYEKPKGQEEEK